MSLGTQDVETRRAGPFRAGDRHATVLRDAGHVRVLPEQPAAAEGVQRDRAVRPVHQRRDERATRRGRHLLVEGVHPVHRAHHVDRTRRSVAANSRISDRLVFIYFSVLFVVSDRNDVSPSSSRGSSGRSRSALTDDGTAAIVSRRRYVGRFPRGRQAYSMRKRQTGLFDCETHGCNRRRDVVVVVRTSREITSSCYRDRRAHRKIHSLFYENRRRGETIE